MIWIFIALIVLMVLLQVRNIMVYRARTDKLEEIFADENWRERVAKYDTISYDGMVLQFWRRPSSMLKDV